MLKLSLHAGLLNERNEGNVLATLDIAYRKREALADYVIALTQRQVGERSPALLTGYPRWSGSLWDLTTRAMAMALYKDGKVPPSSKPDKRCAYATRLCAVLEKHTVQDKAVVLGHAELWQQGPERGIYSLTLREDILGERKGQFAYGCKRLDPLDLLLRGLCWTLFQQDTPGPRPKLILPTCITVDGEERFDLASLQEPARTGFGRFLAATRPTVVPSDWVAAKDYVQFLMEG